MEANRIDHLLVDVPLGGDQVIAGVAKVVKQFVNVAGGQRILAEDRFPRIWVPTAAERDGRQLLLHRHKLVRMRTQVKNQLQALALNQGAQRKWKLWSQAGRKQLESLPQSLLYAVSTVWF